MLAGVYVSGVSEFVRVKRLGVVLMELKESNLYLLGQVTTALTAKIILAQSTTILKSELRNTLLFNDVVPSYEIENPITMFRKRFNE